MAISVRSHPRKPRGRPGFSGRTDNPERVHTAVLLSIGRSAFNHTAVLLEPTSLDSPYPAGRAALIAQVARASWMLRCSPAPKSV